MLNKKAIAAFAAGATLLSGMAFAAPAFAAETPKKPTAEQCKNAQDKIDDAKAALATAKANSVLAGDAKKAAHKKLDKATGLVNVYTEALKDVKAKEAAYTDAEDKDAARSALTQSVKKLNEALKNIADNKGDGKTFPAATQVPADAAVAQGAGTVTFTGTKDSFKAALEGLATKPADEEAQQAEDKVSAAQDKLDLAEIHLKNLGCEAKSEDPTPTPDPKPTPKPVPQTPASDPFNFLTDALHPTTQSQAIDYVRFADMNLQNATNNKALKKKAYDEAAAALKAATAEYLARANALKAAELALDTFMANGADDSATLTKLNDAVDRAQAHFARATNALKAAQAKFDAALAAANDAVKAYNHALSEYKRLYNEAIVLGVNPALLPPVRTNDPLAPNFPDITTAKALYADALSGKFGKDAQAIAKKSQKDGKEAGKKADAKKGADKAAPLAKTGAAVALAAVAASVLAGMGAALRKIRH